MVRSLRLVVGLLVMMSSVTLAEPPDDVISPLIEANELVSEVAKPDVVVLDARSAKLYEVGHLEGAVWVDEERWGKDSHSEKGGLSNEATWRGRIGALGIGPSTRVLIYDDGSMTAAARVWFILQHFGLPYASVVNGGYPAVQRAATSGELRISVERTAPRPRPFVPATQPAAESLAKLATKDELKAELESNSVQVIDARTPDEFAGKDTRGNARVGHMPQAVNIPHAELMNVVDQTSHGPVGSLKSKEELEAIFEKAGVERNRPLSTHCQAGGRAALMALALRVAGYDEIDVYYRSFGEWAQDQSCPIVRPD